MRIIDLLRKESIELAGKATNKAEAIDELVGLMLKRGNIKDVETYKTRVLKREEEGTTGIGDGVAIPHGKSDTVTEPGLAVMVVKDGLNYESLDGQPTKLFFLIAAPDTEDNVHLDVLGRLSALLVDQNFIADLINASTPEEFLNIIDKAERNKFEDEYKNETINHDGYRILAVTACPTGIAHTYMAAEALESAAKDMGISIKVETDGSGGRKNVLTAAEIEACECIIISADKNVEMTRFHGKPVILTKVANGIHKPKELIEKAISGSVKPYQSVETAYSDRKSAFTENESIGRKIYKHLMNGVSHMLPFVIGGGILIALAFLFDGSNAGTDIFGSGNDLSAFLKKIGDISFGMMFPILAGYIAMSIGDRPALAPGLVGGMIAAQGVSISIPQAEWIPSGFFGALIAGFLAGYLMLGLRKLCDKLPKTLEGTKSVLIYPLFGVLITGAIIVFLVNPPVGTFNSWLNGVLNSMGNSSKILLGAILGGMMSIDFGGPFNKAAYVFGTASIASGQPDIMAAVMVGGMVPPIAIALATTFFKNRFTSKERQTTVTNYIMGASFITEGAIPFAASDPLRIIPACVLGSATAGALSMAFGCASPAPHGGLFVLPVLKNPAMFIVSLLIGAVVAMGTIVILKKPIKTAE